MPETPGAPCGHSATQRCVGLTQCRDTIRNRPGQTLAEYLTDDEKARLAAIRFDRPCAGCGEPIVTELAFAEHFAIPDMRYPGLGECPHKEREGAR